MSAKHATCALHRDQADPFVEERLAEDFDAWRQVDSGDYERGVREGLRQAETAARAAQADARFSLTRHGRQVVVVGGGYAYLAPRGEACEVGDEVLTPGNWFRQHAEWQRVESLGSDYDGDIKSVLAVRRA